MVGVVLVTAAVLVFFYLPIAVLISGGGTTLRNLIERIRAGALPVEIRLVISSNPKAAGLRLAEEAGIPTLVVEKTKSLGAGAFSDAVFGPCRAAGVRYVVMGGFLKHVFIPPDFENRVLNIHPALLPAFGGKGMYGRKVHEAVIASGDKQSGPTVHLADEVYDHGKILEQMRVPVLPGDTPETLAARVLEAEHELYPIALNKLIRGEYIL